MKEFKINSNEQNQRFDKYLKKLLPNASISFLYKMLRKKNIVLNGKKATGKEKLNSNDIVKIFFSDETYNKFSIDPTTLKNEYNYFARLKNSNIKYVYENDDIIIIDKPANLLSQKAQTSDVSANEYILGHLIQENKLSFEDYCTFKPSICNRLDRNTTGLLIAGKTLKGLQDMSEALKNRTVQKYYRCIVSGKVTENQHLKGYIVKDDSNNKVEITQNDPGDGQLVETSYKVIANSQYYSYLEIHLITGKTHQIRGHLASIGHPVVGDMKYGDQKVNAKANQLFKVKHQLLHAYRLEFENGEKIVAEVPGIFEKILNKGEWN